MDPEASLQSMEAAVASLCAGYSAGCVLAICAAVRHRWQHLPKQERAKILLVLRILRLLDASAPALAAAALAAGSVPVLGAKAGIERKQVEAAFGSKVALLLVELQQLATITRTFEAEARESGRLSPGQADLVQTLLTAQRTQSSSSETLIIFLAKKAAQLRQIAFRLSGARRGSNSASPEHLVAAALGTEVFGSLANLLGLGRGLLFATMKFVGRLLADRQLARVHPPNARRLSTEDFEALACRTGLTRAEIARLYVSFMKITGGNSHEDVDKVIEELPYFEGPLQDRMKTALKLPEKVDFVILATALSVFSERAALDDKMRFLFRMYSSDLGSVSKQDLTNLMNDVLPPFPDDDERNRLIDRAVQGTFE
ncbi:unnamed protein product, partial [Symbiodinium necroappetens]